MRVALVYDRLNKLGGAEHVLTSFHTLFPEANWYTSVWDPSTAPFSAFWKVHSFPYLHQHHEWFPWLMPFIFESFDFSAYDLVISIGSAESKGVITPPSTVHLNYCLTPTRYLYSHKKQYLTTPVHRFIAKYLRAWDQVASTRPDIMIAISTQVKKRINKYYNRDSEVIFPPVNVAKFNHRPLTINHLPYSYFLTVSRLVPYKNIDVLVKAFNQNGKILIVIGTGSQERYLRKLAKSNVHILGSIDEELLVGYYQHAKAFLQANEEDFGIAMCEAQAAGIPVIAHSSGGALDIVQDGQTGLLFKQTSVSSICQAIDIFETMSFDRQACQRNARHFDQTAWAVKMNKRINKICQKNQK